MARTPNARARVSLEDRRAHKRFESPKNYRARRNIPRTNPGTRQCLASLSDRAVRYYETSRLSYASTRQAFRANRIQQTDNELRLPENGHASCRRHATREVAPALWPRGRCPPLRSHNLLRGAGQPATNQCDVYLNICLSNTEKFGHFLL